ncbi:MULTISPECIES: NUDIX domain-containing protein [Nocardia]|uniref:NUDIX domain-containing protein n=1 Tax=Nocardia TaxID=1817 RepID=UPI000BEFB36A|nr:MULTISPECIES: NUDIX hydrolase [Nocardia]MBF6141218.1 NUDIX hydrolase [Nocardia farcinica]MBF6186935.1 NUDIX hydrolase [Nocardia farcinica]MBF6311977.1 NUDIX hydrolase [Nocardia farcinica]MBF6384650.1 NUDIX hydrolase [Nocardia farcinica]MBF6406851.1 NUDIX hydrolase [Nocardia farcinica]
MSAVEKPLYERDPEAYAAHIAEGNAILPRKLVSADVLLFDQQGRILLVDPNYKPGWDLPGGNVEANEPPDAGALRELHEELGLELSPDDLDLLCVDWVSPHSRWDDWLKFIFGGLRLTDSQIAGLRIEDEELTAFEFCSESQARQRLGTALWTRVEAALDADRTGKAVYLRDGRPNHGYG